MNTVRKSVTITKENVCYIDKLIVQNKEKNFSQAVNRSIDQRRQNEANNNDSNSDAI